MNLLRPHPLAPSAGRRTLRQGGTGKGNEGVGGEARGVVRGGVVALSLLAAVLSTTVTFAQEPTPSDDEVNAIARGLYCPVCENVPLDVCPTQACEQWRATIREKLALGWTEQQIQDYFVAQYGDRVLATPPPRGFNWLVYVLPPLAIAGAGVILWRTMRRWQRAARPDVLSAGLASEDPYVRRLEEELRRRG